MTHSPERQKRSKRRVSLLGVLGFPNEEQTLGLPAFNGANPKSFVTVGLKFKYRGRFLPHHLIRN